VIKPITFCINTANNERDYILLLLNSLKDHTQIELHEVLVFVDTDNQNTYEALLDFKSEMPTLKVCKNPKQFPVWYQRNVSILFEAAQNDIVCYLHSDMVVGKDFDKHICDNLQSENTILCCARIEPPLHPASPEKVVKDFGITPAEFQYDNFNKYVEELQAENRPNQWGHMVPFVLHKSVWFDVLGGFDTQFRNSREDGDMITRMGLCGFDLVQCWNACVYHFTCVSSRGKDWYASEKAAQLKNQLQGLADIQEHKRYIRKWGAFGLFAQPVFDIAFDVDLDRVVDMQLLKFLEPYGKRLYINNSTVADQLVSQLSFESDYYNNLRWGYTPDHWNTVRHLHNPTDFQKRVLCGAEERVGDVIVTCKYSEFADQWSEEVKYFIENLHKVVEESGVGEFIYGPFHINIKQKVNLMNNNKKMTHHFDSQIYTFK
jgi:hypothetical protein